MPPLPDAPRSLWREPTPPPRSPLDGPADVDVVVIGAGITGLATAVLAARGGSRVLVLEDRSIGAGATGFSTAKVTVLHGTKYSKLARLHGEEVAARYAAAQNAGLEWLRTVHPGMETATALTYATDDQSRAEVEAEVHAAKAAGIDARLVEDVDVPYATRGAVAVDGQGQVHPTPLLEALASELETLGGRICEGTRATGVRDGGAGAVVRTGAGEVRADWAVVATHLPFLDRTLLFARAEPSMSHVIAVRTGGRLPEGMLLSASSPVRSLRTAPDPERPGERVLVVGGESHKTGDGTSTAAAYQTLLDWTREHFAVEDVPWKWGTEDYLPDDSLPFVGPAWALPSNVLVATGYAKWGFTNAPAAAMVMAARILGQPAPEWAGDWETRRVELRRGGRELAKFNGDVAKKLATGWVKAVARSRRVPPTVSAVDVEGRRHEVSGVCTHLGGIVNWNDGDGCWDCPLHGSRFEPDGTLLHGPAVRDLGRGRR